MREIKYRAWRKNLGGMFYLDRHGDMHGNVEQLCLLTFLEQDHDKTIDLEWMQYTGLKDKNGKEIYEGDIVDYHCQHVQVIFMGNHGAFGLRGLEKWDCGFLPHMVSEIEVIGNIYENPELLK